MARTEETPTSVPQQIGRPSVSFNARRCCLRFCPTSSAYHGGLRERLHIVSCQLIKPMRLNTTHSTLCASIIAKVTLRMAYGIQLKSPQDEVHHSYITLPIH